MLIPWVAMVFTNIQITCTRHSHSEQAFMDIQVFLLIYNDNSKTIIKTDLKNRVLYIFKLAYEVAGNSYFFLFSMRKTIFLYYK